MVRTRSAGTGSALRGDGAQLVQLPGPAGVQGGQPCPGKAFSRAAFFTGSVHPAVHSLLAL